MLIAVLLCAGTISAGALKITTEVPQPLLGDADGDGRISIMDSTAIQRYLASYTVAYPEIVRTRGDVNQSGLDIMDATVIQRFLVSYYVPYNIGEPI